MKNTLYALHRTGSVIFSALAVVGVYTAIATLGPITESQFFPVIKKFAVEDSYRIGDDVYFRPEFTKVRRCDYIGISWYLGEPGKRFVRVPLRFMNTIPGPQTRPIGRQTAEGYWKTVLQRGAPRDNMFGIVFHDCNLFWTTQTIVGPVAIPR